MNESLVDDETLPLSRKSVLPGAGFFTPDSVRHVEAEREARETIEGAGTIVVADPDADGLACVALVREALGEGALLPAGPHELAEAIGHLVEFADPETRVFVCDLCPDREADVAELEALTELATVSWFDHHQWDETLTRRVAAAGVELVVGDSETECSADVTLRSLEYGFDDRFADLAAVTRDHDLWIREDPRSDDLADYAYWEEPEAYVDVVGRFGADLPEPVETYIQERRVEKDALIDLAVKRGRTVEVGPWTVGVTYGRCSQNEVAEAFREQGADAAVVVKPAGSASIRGTDGFELCHEVAGQVNGGGHPKAAGCKPDIYDDMLDYAHHWSTRGAEAQRTILDAFEVVAEAAAGAENTTEG
jgi:oligoribonuclease NrnB/cAMP/cGMP phosphodiesterase (DHH superfamily)